MLGVAVDASKRFYGYSIGSTVEGSMIDAGELLEKEIDAWWDVAHSSCDSRM